MKIVNLDQITTKRDKVIILDGKEHVMHTPTVQDYIEQMKQAEAIEKLAAVASTKGIDGITEILNLTIATLMKSFPTITEAQFRSLTMDKLNALRALAEDSSDEQAPEPAEGEATGKLD